MLITALFSFLFFLIIQEATQCAVKLPWRRADSVKMLSLTCCSSDREDSTEEDREEQDGLHDEDEDEDEDETGCWAGEGQLVWFSGLMRAGCSAPYIHSGCSSSST